MTTSPRPALSCCSGGSQAGPRAPAWGPQLPPPPPPHLLSVSVTPRVFPLHLGRRPGSLPAAPPCADAEGEGAAMRPGAGDPLCEYWTGPVPSQPQCPLPASGPREPWKRQVPAHSSLAGALP
ncbi:hypothetical protein NN561_013583 [Cricetulus griseus]